MEFLKLLTSGITFPYALYTVCVYLINFVESSRTDLPNYIIPKHYDIYLRQVTNDNKYFVGECQVHIRIDHPTQNIYLHAQSPQIEVLSFVLNNTVKPKNYTYNNESHIFDIYFIDVLSIGYYILKVEYCVNPDNDGGLFTTFFTYKKGLKKGLVATVSQVGARRVFPCLDEPMFKATFNITIKHFFYYFSLSNMPAKNIKTEGMVLTSFNKTPVISTYAVAITLLELIGTFSFNNHTWYHKLPSQYIKFSVNFVFNVMEHMKYEKWNFDITTLKHVVIPNYPYESREYFGLIFYRESAIIYDEASDPFMCKINVARIVTRAVIYQWMTNLVTLSQWSHMWINQGVSSLIAADIITKIYPESRMSDLFAVQIRQESLLLDTDTIRKSLISKTSTYEINLFFFYFNYLKVPAILSMLQSLLTNELFWNGTKIFLNKPFANRDELWTAMQTTLDESFITQKFDVKERMDLWIQLEHYPVLEVTEYDSRLSKITLGNYTLSNYNKLWIPITTQNISIQSQDPIEWFEVPEHIDAFFCFDKNIISLKQGYYRVNYPVTQWLEIAKDLNIDHKKIHVFNRAQIIDDAFYFLIRGKLSLFVFLKVVEYLQNEMDYIAWYPMFKALEYISCFIPFDEYNYASNIKIYMQNILAKLLDKIGYTEYNDDNDLLKCLRQEAAKWACNLGDYNCKENAFTILKMHLSEPAEYELLPWWTKWTYCYGLMSPYSDNIWWTVFNIWTKTSNNTLLEVLSCSVSPFIVPTYLKIISDTSNCTFDVSRCKNNRVNERIISFLLSIAKNANNNKILQYILDDFDNIKPREVSIIAIFIIIINHTYSEKSLDQITKFVIMEENKKYVDHTHNLFTQKNIEEINSYVETLLKQVTSSIQDKIKMREIEIMEQKHNFRNSFVDKSEI